MDICKCGRPFEHCRLCGSRTVYPKKFKSMDETERLGIPVTVYGCRGCNRQTNSLQECAAKPYIFEPAFSPDTSASHRPQDILDPDTPAYQEAVSRRAEELMSGRNKKTLEEAIAIMKLEGWKVELEAPASPPSETVNPVVEEKPLPALSMDDIINAMKGEKK